MHEMSLCEGILDILEAEAEKQQFSRVKKLWLEIGDLAFVEIDALKFCYDMVVKNTVAHDSELVIEQIAAVAECQACSASMPVKTKYDACITCGSYELEVTEGDQMKIKEVEVE